MLMYCVSVLLVINDCFYFSRVIVKCLSGWYLRRWVRYSKCPLLLSLLGFKCEFSMRPRFAYLSTLPISFRAWNIEFSFLSLSIWAYHLHHAEGYHQRNDLHIPNFNIYAIGANLFVISLYDPRDDLAVLLNTWRACFCVHPTTSRLCVSATGTMCTTYPKHTPVT